MTFGIPGVTVGSAAPNFKAAILTKNDTINQHDVSELIKKSNITSSRNGSDHVDWQEQTVAHGEDAVN